MPLVSVIIPNYNHEKYLTERIESVLTQTFDDFELIILDDNSTDNSRQVIEQYRSHPKVSHIVLNRHNSGSPFKQWQKGVALATGKYIWIAESDDYCVNNFLESLIPQFTEKTAIVYCASNVVNENSEYMGENNWANSLSLNRWKNNFINEGNYEIDQYMRYKNIIPNASAVLFTKEAVKNVVFPVDMYFCGDWWFWIQLLEQGSISYVAKSLNSFRKHDKTTRATQHIKKELRRYKEYTKVINATSNFIEQVKNRKKYFWILNEWEQKNKNKKKWTLLHVTLPLSLYLVLIKRVVFNK